MKKLVCSIILGLGLLVGGVPNIYCNQSRDQEIKELCVGQERFIEPLKQGKIQLGMSKMMVIYVRGYPNKINKSIGRWGTHEQWVYSSVYFYFENGVLTSWQEFS